VFIATTGGVAILNSDGKRVTTVLDGLPSNEVLGVSVRRTTLHAVTPRGSAIWTGAGWEPIAEKMVAPEMPKTPLPLPDGGTHATACLWVKGEAWVGIYGSGVWHWDGSKWGGKPVTGSAIKEPTALGWNIDTLLIGTRRSGVWSYRDGALKPVLQPTWTSHNAQSLAISNGSLLVGTLTDGIQLQQGDKFSQLPTPPGAEWISQVVPFGRTFAYRIGSGRVFVGGTNELIAKDTTFLSADRSGLIMGRYGGWSTYGAKGFAASNDPHLKGISPTCRLDVAGTTYVGTQNRGLLVVRNGTPRGLDEGRGMPDDWITCLADHEGSVFAGTFVGGLAVLQDGQLTHKLLPGENVTAMQPFRGRLYISTRYGLFRWSSGRVEPIVFQPRAMTAEIQCMAADEQALYLGTRTGVYRIPAERL
jgi:hypothetical protein